MSAFGAIAVSLLLALQVSPTRQSNVDASTKSQSDDRTDKWRADIDELQTILLRVHPRYRGTVLPDSVQQRLGTLRGRVDSLSDERIVVELQRALASVGDGHTLLWPFAMNRGVLLHAPVQLWLFPEGLYVIDAADARLVGKRVTAIGSLTAQKALDAVAPFVSHDNKEQLAWAAPFYATLTDFLVAVGAQRSRDSLTLGFSDGAAATLAAAPIDPSTLQIKLIAPKGATVPEYLARSGETFWTTLIRPGLLNIALNGVTDTRSKTLADFGKELRPALGRVSGVVLDLRLNNGGDALKADELLRSLIAFDVRGGRIAVLTSRMTFSAAQTLAARLDQWTNAVFIGEATGSAPNHYGNEQNFRLPYSGVRGTIASGLNQAVTARDQRATIEPDLPVALSATDYFRGRDPVLDAAVRNLSRRTQTTRGKDE